MKYKQQTMLKFLSASILILSSIAFIFVVDHISYESTKDTGTVSGRLNKVDISGYSGNIIGVRTVSEFVTPSGKITGYAIEMDSVYNDENLILKIIFDDKGLFAKKVTLSDDTMKDLDSYRAFTEFIDTIQNKRLPCYLEDYSEDIGARPYDFIMLTSLKDGFHTSENIKFNDDNIYGTVALEIIDGKITSMFWNFLDAFGVPFISAESLEPNNSSSPILTWEQQATEITNYVVKYQSVESIILDESGRSHMLPNVDVDIRPHLSSIKNAVLVSIEYDEVDGSLKDYGTILKGISGELETSAAIIKCINDASNFLHSYILSGNISDLN